MNKMIFGTSSYTHLDGNYIAFHRLGQAKFAYGGLILGSRYFTLLPQLTLKMMLNLKIVKINWKIIMLLF